MKNLHCSLSALLATALLLCQGANVVASPDVSDKPVAVSTEFREPASATNPVSSNQPKAAGEVLTPHYVSVPAVNVVPASTVVAPVGPSLPVNAVEGLQPGGSGLPTVLSPVSSSTSPGPPSTSHAPVLVPPQTKQASQTAEPNARPIFYVYDFSANWCPSCRGLEPFLRQMEAKYQGYIELIPVDVDKKSSRQLVKNASLRAIPTIIVSDREGHQLQRLVGFQQGLRLDRILSEYLQRATSSAPLTR